MLEPDVTLTDFAITAACGGFIAVLLRRDGPLVAAFIRLFVFTGFAALTAGIVHGWLPDSSLLWSLSMLAVGGAATALLELAARHLLDGRARRAALGIINVVWAVFAAWIVFVDSAFRIAVLGYAAATVIALVALFVRPLRHGGPAIAGLALALVAGVLQQRGYTPLGVLDHNAFFHLLQLAALTGLFITAWKGADHGST